MNNEQNIQAGANFLTNDQIAAGAAIECDHGAPIGRNVAIDVFDAMRAAAPAATEPVAYMSTDRTLLAFAESVNVDHPYRSFGMVPLYVAPVAAQAGQVAVPEGWSTEKYDDPHYGNAVRIHGPCGFATVREGSCDPTESVLYRYFTAPSAPAVAQQAPALHGMEAAAEFVERRAAEYLRDHASTEEDTGAIVWQFGDAGRDYHSSMVELAEDLRQASAPAVCTVPPAGWHCTRTPGHDGPCAASQASTPDGRQEGGAA